LYRICGAVAKKLRRFVQMFVFGEVQDPNSETVNLVEDIVRGQIIELVRVQ
jgi:hypothetical protein